MKRLLCALLWMAAGLASADDLSDANKLLAAKAYDKAFPIYSKLANAGNPEAQFRLGEMYWYGDGTAADMANAAAWMGKAAASGHPAAKESLVLLKERGARSADIEYWTSQYKGEDLTAGKFDCPRPPIPLVSKTNDEIKAVSAALAKWEACYNGFAANLNDAMPPGKRIPADVVKLMTPREIEAASRHLDEVYGDVIGKAQASAAQLIAERDAWHGATEKFVTAQNVENEARKRDYELLILNKNNADLERNRNMNGNNRVPGAPAPRGR